MKFTQNTSIMNPNTINAQYRIVTDPMAYGTAGKEWSAMAGAVGQMVKLAQEKQDDADAADHMSRRNAIMGNITERLYGENGVLTTGIGENAKGLTDRVTQVVKEEFDNGLKGANRRVRRSMLGTFNENMANYQRISAQQEGREFQRNKAAQYDISITDSYNRAMNNYADENLLESNIQDIMRVVDWRASDMGMSESQRLQERRNVLTQIVSGAMDASIANGDLQTASIYYDRYGKYMNQREAIKYQQTIRTEKNLVEERNLSKELVKKHTKPDGTVDWPKIYDEIDQMAKATKTVGGGNGSYSGNAETDQMIIAAAQKYNLDPAQVAAIADIESTFRQDAVSGVGALGIMQLMPDTAASLGVDPYNKQQNIEGGAKYLRQMLDTFGGDETKAVAAYNAGPGAVKSHGGVPPYKETQDYVRKYQDALKKYKSSVPPYSMPTQGGNIDEQVNNLKDTWKHGVIDWVGGVVKNVFKYTNPTISSAARSSARNAQVSTSGDKSWHVHNDALDVVFDEGQNLTQEQKDKLVNYFKNTGMFSEVLYHNYGSGWHLHLGGLKKSTPPGGAGGGGHVVNAHDSGWADRMKRYVHADITDLQNRQAYETQDRLQGYINQIQNTGSSSDALAIVERVRNSNEPSNVYSAVVQAANRKWPGAFGSSRGGTGGGGRGRSGNGGYVYLLGKRYSMAQIEEYDRLTKEYNYRLQRSNFGVDRIGDDQPMYNHAAKVMTAYWKLQSGKQDYSTQELLVTKEAWEQTQDYNKTIKWLQDVYGMTAQEAVDRLDYYLSIPNDDQKDNK